MQPMDTSQQPQTAREVPTFQHYCDVFSLVTGMTTEMLRKLAQNMGALCFPPKPVGFVPVAQCVCVGRINILSSLIFTF